MLTEIFIKDLITIEDLHLEFQPRTTMISGETGTGKSILIDAINLALGSRASEQLVRPGAEKVDISICFDIRNLPEAALWLKQHELDDETHCIIRRHINKEGRSRTYINARPITTSAIRELSDLIIHIHGQHEYQSLLKNEKQRDILDRFALHDVLIKEVKELAKTCRTLKEKILQLELASQEKNQQCDFIQFQLKDLESLALKENEFDLLDQEHKKLASVDELLKHLHHAFALLSENEEQNAQLFIKKIIQSLTIIQHLDPKITQWIELLNEILHRLDEVDDEVKLYLEKIDADPLRLEQIEKRLSVLFNAARKYKTTPQALFNFQNELTNQLTLLQNNEQHITELSSQLIQAQEEYLQAAAKLTLSRKKAAKKLTAQINPIIHALALPNAEFHIEFESETQGTYPTQGLEKIIFFIKTNEGLPAQPLAKIVSGGELSRISLAIRVATAEKQVIPTLIFDEIDIGISGSTAAVVGKMLRQLGNDHQVLCVTHLPQVAAQGHHHLKVEKIKEDIRTKTHIQPLNDQQKIHEIARMLGGVEITEKTVAHAREMLETCAD